MRNKALKVKVKTLAAEAKIIRKEELKLTYHRRNATEDAHREEFDMFRNSLVHHRTKTLRTESRSSQVAYGFLNGYSYASIEEKAKSHPDWDSVERMVIKFRDPGIDVRDIQQHLAQWVSEAKALVEKNMEV